jgi:hypothetical protein
MPRCYLTLLLLCTVLAGCIAPIAAPNSSPAPADERPAPPQSPPARPSISERMTLAYQGTAATADRELWITFQDIVEDSRCPADVNCAWSGWVRIELLVRVQNGPANNIELTAFTDQRGGVLPPREGGQDKPNVQVGDYQIQLKEVMPYPATASAPTPHEQYQIVLQLDKALSMEPASSAVAPVVTCPEAPELPMLCYSNRAITEYAAGSRTEPPMLLTAPLASCALPDQSAGDAICAATFGEGWEMADTASVAENAVWYDFVPAGTSYWVWDEQAGELAAQG